MGSNQSFAGLSLNVRSTPTHQRQRPVFSARNRSSAVFSAPVDGCSGGLVSCSASGRSSGQKCPMLIPLTLHSAHRFAPQNAPETAPVPVTDWKSLLASSEGKDSYHPSQTIRTWKNSRRLGHRYPRNAPVCAPVVSGVPGVEGGPSEVVEGPCHGSP